MNRYIKAMEIGLAHEREGISYNDLKAKIEKFQGESFNENSESTFVYWFMENFTYRNGKFDPNDFRKTWLGHLEFLNGDKAKIKHSLAIKGYLVNKYFLDGHAAKQYLDYVEYKSARESSQKAQVAAIISILIAAASFYFTYQATKETPKPPYDVKVIEDNTKNQELEQIKQKLHKAEMKLKAYESDSTKS
ncbi:hypothetical protein F8C76_11260 [Flagellimonas olearia]|uniref:Uncharacterized protein n=1 Tax=Flagellimonas olearia TaxID=552546 RepID=A0A6I1DWM4_9FLAO|nr:hypothetical protein [Allomuricauda olearia]KAB7528434.1 hypothetical protein F8C76_11260 [Allomuricauda olearia]